VSNAGQWSSLKQEDSLLAVLALSFIVRWILPEKGPKDYSKLARYSTEHT
jgi:hypothetical protein